MRSASDQLKWVTHDPLGHAGADIAISHGKLFSGSGSFEGWCDRMARNVCVNLCVKRCRLWRLLHGLKTGGAEDLNGWNPECTSTVLT